MNKALANLQDLKSVFISYCKTLGCEDNYIRVCKNKFDTIETELKKIEIFDAIDKLPAPQLYHNDDDSIGIVGENEFVLVSKKKLKAFEIIKRDYYLVAECLDKYNSFEEMQKDLGEHCPFKTEEEFDLLKEALK